MKIIKLIPTFLLILLSTSGFSQNWIWSQQIGGSQAETCGSNSICHDFDGNIYMSGTYHSNPCYLLNDTLVSMSGISDFYIAKYDVSGNELWVKSFGGHNSTYEFEAISNIIFDSFTNSLFVNGEFYEKCLLGSDTLESRGSSDVFVARLDLDGNIIWAKQLGGTGEDLATAMVVDKNGAVYLSFLLPAGGQIDSLQIIPGVYFVKLDPNSHLIWAERKFNINTTIDGYDAIVLGLAISDNHLFGIGYCSIDSFNVDSVKVLTSLHPGQNILCCMDTNHATVRWMKTFGSSNPLAMNLSTDSFKNNFITGSIHNDAIFDDDTLHSSNGNEELIIAKYDSMGHKQWVKQATSSVGAYGSCVALDNEGGAYFTGGIYGTVTLDTFSVNTSVNGDLFIARYNSNGNCLGFRQVADGNGSSMLVSDDNKIYINGKFSHSITFGSTTTLTSYGQSDVFLAKCDAITGVGEELRLANNQLLIYANPTKGICNVTIPDEFKHEHTLNLQVFDLGGKLLQESTLEMQGGEIKINLEQEAKGIYNINLSNRTKTYRGKVVFE